MKRNALNRQTRRVSILCAVTAACAAVGSAQTPNTADVFSAGTAFDTQGDWSLNQVPASTNDAVLSSYFSNAASTPTLASNVSFGSLDDLLPSATSYFNIYGASTNASGGNLNNSIFTISLGAGGNNSSTGNLNNGNGVAGANANDLIYVASGGELDVRLGYNTTNYALVVLNILANGNFDAAGTGVIYDNNRIYGTGTITKTGTGTLLLESTSSTNTGGLVIDAGVVSLPSGGALGAVPATAATQLTFAGSSTLQVTSTAGFGSTRTFNISNGSVATIDGGANTFGIQGSIIGNGSLVKLGTGTITFNSSSGYTYNGSTTVTGGLNLNVSSTMPNTPLILVAGTLQLDSGFRFNQSFPSVSLNAGANAVAAPNFNVSGLSLSLGQINRSIGATCDFVLPGINGTVTGILANANFSGGQQTIAGGWATANGQSTWAVAGGTNTTSGTISALPQSAYDQTFAVAGADVDVTASVTPGVTTINSMRFNAPGASVTVTVPTSLTIATGGILQTAAAGTSFNYISGGTLTSNSGEVTFTQADTSGFLFVDSVITDSSSGSVAVAKSGAGVLFLDEANTFTGPTYDNAGTLELNNSLALQYSTLSSIGNILFEAGPANDVFTIGGLASNSTINLNDSSGAPVVLTFGGNNANTTFNGIFNGSGSVVKVGTGTTYLANGNSAFTGGMNISAGTIAFISGASFGSASGPPVLICNGAGIAYNQAGASVFGINRSFNFGGGTETIQVGSLNTTSNISTSALTIGQYGNASSGMLLGSPSTPSTLVKTGLGTLILANTSTFVGGTTVDEGYLVAQTPASLGLSAIPGDTGSGPLVIAPTQLFAQVAFQTSSASIDSLTNYVSGNASAGAASVVLGSASAGGSTALTIGYDGTSTTFSGNIGDLSANYSGAVGSVIKIGSGTLTLSGSNTYNGGTTVTAGGLTLASGTAFPTGTSLNIASGATVTIANHGSIATYVPVVATLINNGKINITNNALILQNASIGAVTAMVASAYNNGAWNGTNSSGGVITSSLAASDATRLTAVGVATGLTSFEGQNVSAGSVLVKYTYYGDANLDGKVDGSDYSRIDAGYLSGGTQTGWANGDFNYDGVINGSDYTLIDDSFNTQGANLAGEIANPTAQIAGGAATAVPEPSILGFLTLGGFGMLRRRRR